MDPWRRPEIPVEAFAPILQELQRLPIRTNYYRKNAGEGRSQAFGVVNKRCRPPDYSRQCWKRAYLYALLLDFAQLYVDVPFNAITVNQNYRADAHYDRGNLGPSFLVAFGNYSGGDLKIHEEGKTPPLGCWDIRHKPIVADFSNVLHSVTEFQGTRISLVFYTAANTPPDLPPPSVKLHNERWTFFRGDEPITDGMPHPLKGKKHKRP